MTAAEDVYEAFLRSPGQFDAWQAYALLNGEEEAWRFGAPASLAFADAEVAGVVRDGDGLRLDLALPGLIGPGTPAPLHLAEAVLRESGRGNDAPQDFLDIFQNRFFRLWFADAEAMCPELGGGGDVAGDLASLCALALAGMLTGGLRGRAISRPGCGEAAPLSDLTFLDCAVLWALPVPSAAGLEKLLETCLGLRVEVEQFSGDWVAVAAARRTRLGEANHALGDTALLGGRMYDPDAGIRIRPRNGEAIPREFLPGPAGSRHGELVSLVTAYAGEDVAVCFSGALGTLQ